MTERLLQYIWQFQHLNSNELQTTDAQTLQVIFAGNYNSNQGPDFLNGKIKIDNTTWIGSIELHINSSDWELHNHSNDKNYNNVILHVVWNDDINLQLPFPTLELKNRVSKLLLGKYEELMQAQYFIPCEKHLHEINELVITKWKESLLVERLQQKVIYIETLLKNNKQHWEETFWWVLARNFGVKINCDTFEKIAQSIPLNLLAKHKNQLIQLEALLMGQAGLLGPNFEEDYPIMLYKEYSFLQKKYKLKPVHLPLYFLRMRPANFPTIRLAQLAMMVHESRHLFDNIKETAEVREAEKLFDITANDYWHYHYVFDEAGTFKKKTLGKEMIHNLFINTVIPMLYAYGYFNSKETFKHKAMRWMEQIAAENNRITKGYELLGIKNNSAFDSQALIQLKNEYCDQKRCLQCAIGNSILKEVPRKDAKFR
ncbi:MAG: DUF2851 family protein [Ferruginibacter sp.]